MTFRKKEIVDAVKLIGLKAPTEMQTILINTTKVDVILKANSGTGKTMAVMLSILNRINRARNIPQAVFVVPTTDLKHQMISKFMEIAKCLTNVGIDCLPKCNLIINNRTSNFRTCNCTIFEFQSDVLKLDSLNQQIVVDVPAKILKWSHLLTKIKMIAFDEADQLFKSSSEDCRKVVDALGSNLQRIFVTSIFSPEAHEWANLICNNPITIEPKSLIDNRKIFQINCTTDEEKVEVVRHLVRKLPEKMRCIIFCEVNLFA